jgi:predicted amidohydrolase
MNVLLIQLQVAAIGEPVTDRISHVETWIRAGIDSKSSSTIHLVLLPETAFCSYCQPNEAAAKKIALNQELVIKQWASDLAKELKCYLAFGYIGIEIRKNVPRNALAVYSPSGVLVRDQSKRFLYASDQVWTSEAEPEFRAIVLDQIAGTPKVMFAICNDINADTPGELDLHPLANAFLKSGAKVLFLSAAWCSAHPDSPAMYHDAPVEIYDQLSYWKERLLPALKMPLYFCCADLVGREPIPNRAARIQYCGTSCGVDLRTFRLLTKPLDTMREGFLVIAIPL